MDGFSNRCLAAQPQPPHRIRLPVPLCWVCSITHRDVSVRAKNVPHRLRFTRALIQSKDFSMWFPFPCAFGSPGSGPAPWKQPLRKDLQEPLFPPAWEVHFTGGEESEPPAGKKRHPIGLCLEASIWKEWVTSPKGDLHICSEDGNFRRRVEVPDCPLSALQRHS